VQRSRVGDNNPHLVSKAQAAQCRAFTIEIFPGVIQPDFMSLQEAVECVASLQAEQLAQLRFRQAAHLVLFQRKCFQSAAGEIAPRSGEALRDIIRNVKSHFHKRSLTRENPSYDGLKFRRRPSIRTKASQEKDKGKIILSQ
jgi:hypothetical protein